MNQLVLKCLALLVTVQYSTASFGQETFYTERYQMQLPMVNPAMSGLWGKDFSAGLQWTSGVLRIAAAPYLRIDCFSKNLSSGFGISATGSIDLQENRLLLRGNYNFQRQFKNQNRLSLGIMLAHGSINSLAINSRKVSAGFGFAFTTKQWHIGLAAQNVLPLYEESTLDFLQPFYVATGHYLFAVSESVSISPEGMLGWEEVNTFFWNVGVKTKYKFAYMGIYKVKDTALFAHISNRWTFASGLLLFNSINLDYSLSTSGHNDFRHTLTFRLYMLKN